MSNFGKTELTTKWPRSLKAVPTGFWLAIAALGFVGFYWRGLTSLVTAWSLPEYSHGFLIPLLAGFLLMRNLEETQNSSSSPTLGLLVMGAALLVGLLGNLTNIPDIVTYGMLLCIAGLILLSAGTRRGFKAWPAWLYLFFMLPLPSFIYWPLSTKLQFLSSQLGVALIQAMGIPVYLEGNIIDLGTYKLQVAEACSGLRYLFPLMSFGFLFAFLYRGPALHRVILFLSTIPITILMNSFRIGVVGLLVSHFGTDQAEGFLHFFEGWMIFGACIAMLVLLCWVLLRFSNTQGPLFSVLDLRLPKLSTNLPAALKSSAPMPLVLGASALALAALIWHWSPAPETSPMERQALHLFPMELDPWHGTSSLLDPEVRRVLGADDYVLADFQASMPAAGTPASASVNLFIAYYNSQTKGTGIHSPEVCLPGSGWEISRWEPFEVAAAPGRKPFTVNRAIIQRGQNRLLVYYWFEQRGRRMRSDYIAKAYTVIDSLWKGRTDGALVRVTTPYDIRDPGAADGRLRNFLDNTIDVFPRYIPPA